MPRNKGMTFNSHRLETNLSTFNERANKGITAAFEYQAPKSAGRMRSEAPWTDRTGNARNGLFTATKHSGTRHSLLLAHGMHYGIYLEKDHSGRYAIVIPEIRRAADDLQRLMTKLLDTIPRG